ncbi:MAG: hypothetical protein MZV63_57945 [Marinilabiliales bacterium]|nr:hypothetical protein [Marinilabiliales bacterium]
MITWLFLGANKCPIEIYSVYKNIKKQFNTTLNAWIYDLLKNNSKLKYGGQFWIITPVTIDQKNSKIPVGFENDSSYFGVIEKWLINYIMAVPDKNNQP